MVMKKAQGGPQTKGRAGTAKPAAKTKTAAGRAAPAKSAPKSRPQTKRATAKPAAKAQAKRASAARPQTKPARTAEASAGDGQEAAIRRMRTGKEIIDAMAKETGQPQTVVRSVLQNLGKQCRRHLRSRGSGKVTIPEINVTLTRKAKPATKPRQGFNPVTREPMTIGPKPARIVVRARVGKRLLESIGAVSS